MNGLASQGEDSVIEPRSKWSHDRDLDAPAGVDTEVGFLVRFELFAVPRQRRP